MRPIFALSAAAAVIAACHGSSSQAPHAPGDDSFVSPAPFGNAPGRGGMSAGAATPASGSADAQPQRAVEEPDIYQLTGTTLYVLNAYRGLLIVDVSDPAQPRLAGRVALEGRPVDLYVRGTVAFVAVAGTFRYAQVSDASGESVRPEQASRLVAIDVSAPATASILGDLAIDGDLDETRIVGDVLYAVTREYTYGAGSGAGTPVAGGTVGSGIAFPYGGADRVLVSSYDTSDPHGLRAVDQRAFDSVGWDTHANVTSSRITLSQSGFDGTGPTTQFQIVDISDPSGALALGASFSSPGTVRDRWAMDFDPATGLFRAAMETGFSAGATLRVWSSPSPSAAGEVGHLDVAVPEALTAARFDGTRAYLVTAVQTDPLFVVDTTDPRNPTLLGEVQMPGRLDYVEPRGDRLLALGHETGTSGAWQLTVSLLDVTDPANPVLRSRVAFGSSFSWVAAAPDDLKKAFQVLDAMGLVLVPLQGWDSASWRYVGGTQLVDWVNDALALRGFLPHAGAITRALVVDADAARLGALSDQSLQLIDASDRDEPKELASLDLARPVAAVELVEGKAIELAGDWYRGATEIAVTDPLDPNAPTPLARISVTAPYARMFRDGDVVWLLAQDWQTGAAWVQAVDLSAPTAPVLRGRLELGQGTAGSWFGGGFGYGDEVVQAGQALALHRSRFLPVMSASAPSCIGCSADADGLTIVDLRDPDGPSATTVTLPANDWSWGLSAAGTSVWMTHFEWADAAGTMVRYYLDRVDLTDPKDPALLPKVNVPGIFFAAVPSGTRIYTQEVVWTAGQPPVTWLHALDLTADDKARLASSLSLDGVPGGAAVSSTHAYLQLWTSPAVPVATSGAVASATASAPTGKIAAVDLGSMQVTSTVEIESGWGWPITAAGGKLFVAAGGWGEGVLVYDLADPAAPVFDRFVPTQGWVEDVAVADGNAYLACGPYGVVLVPLTGVR